MTPRSYQIPAIEKHTSSLRRYGVTIDTSDPGTGKTFVAALTARALGWPVFVVCPKSVIPSWRSALAQAPVEVIDIQNLEKLMARKHYVTCEGKKWRWTLPKRCLLIIDEAHRMCGSDTASGKLLGAAPKPLMLLSATLADSPLRMRWVNHQLGVCHSNEWFGWCLRNGCRRGFFGGIEYHGGADTMARIREQIFAEMGVCVRIADLGDAFPHNTVDTVLVPVADGDAIDSEYYNALLELEAESPTAAVAMLRARQLSEFQKVPAITEMAEDYLEQGCSVVVFVNFRDSLARLQESFPSAVSIYGGQDAEERQKAIEAFQANQSRICLSMIQAGGVAVSLHDLGGNNPRVSLICPGWSAVELIQTLGRIHRNGGKSPCLQKLVFADDTIEQRVQRKVRAKVDNIMALNDNDLNLEEL